MDELEELCDFIDVEYKQKSKNQVALTSNCNNQSYLYVSRIEVIFSFPRKMPHELEKNL
jgi:adenylate cyclase class IV